MSPFIVGRRNLVKGFYSPPLKKTIIQKLKIGRTFYLLLAFIPISILLYVFTKEDSIIFITSVLAIVPLARIMGYTTK